MDGREAQIRAYMEILDTESKKAKLRMATSSGGASPKVVSRGSVGSAADISARRVGLCRTTAKRGALVIRAIDEADSLGDHDRVKSLRKCLGKSINAAYRMLNKNRSRVVYFILAEGTGLVKIGKSDDIKTRLNRLSFLSPVPLRLLATIPGGSSEETRLHKRFAHLRHHGEWFQYCRDLRRFVAGISPKSAAGLVGTGKQDESCPPPTGGKTPRETAILTYHCCK